MKCWCKVCRRNVPVLIVKHTRMELHEEEHFDEEGKPQRSNERDGYASVLWSPGVLCRRCGRTIHHLKVDPYTGVIKEASNA